MVDILDLIKDLKTPGEVYMLQRKAIDPDAKDDGLGDLEETWIDIQEIFGDMDKTSVDPETWRGSEEITEYKGYFHANFDIPTNELGQYRVRHTLPASVNSKLVFTRYFGIKEFDRNLSLDNTTVYVGMLLELSKKWNDL